MSYRQRSRPCDSRGRACRWRRDTDAYGRQPAHAQRGKSGKDALHYIHGLFGISLSGGDKDVPPGPANPFLGVISDLSRVVEGVAVMRIKLGRVAGIILAIEDMLGAGAAPAAAFDRLVGELEYTTSTGAAVRFGRSAERRWRTAPGVRR